MPHIDHDRIKRDLASDFHYGGTLPQVTYILNPGDSLTERYTSTRGRTYAGPARVQVTDHGDGVTVQVSE